MKVKPGIQLRRIGLAAAMIALAGCSTMGPDPGISGKPARQASAAPAGPPPKVQDCGIVGIGSPTKYVCNDKVYTSFDLAKLRTDWAKPQTDPPRQN